MLKLITCYLSCLLVTVSTYAQPYAETIGEASAQTTDQLIVDTTGAPATTIYRIKPAVDFPLEAAAAAWDLYGFAQVGKKDGASEAKVNALNKSSLPWFDRWAVRPYNRSVDKLSYVPFYVAMPLPLIVFSLDKKLRKDFGKLTFLYAEAMTLTGVLYTSSVHYINRFRPLVYSSESPMNIRESSNARNAFFAGHVALVGTSVFFVAKVLSVYHPDSKMKWLYYSLAGAITGATAYLRHRAGEHFPSDIFVGTGVGVASGLLTPSLHRIRSAGHQRLTILPFSGQGHGVALLYRL